MLLASAAGIGSLNLPLGTSPVATAETGTSAGLETDSPGALGDVRSLDPPMGLEPSPYGDPDNQNQSDPNRSDSIAEPGGVGANSPTPTRPPSTNATAATTPAPQTPEQPTAFRWPGFPPPGLGEQTQRILPRRVATTSGAYRFVQTQPNGAPVGYSPCRVWPIVVNLTNSPPGAYDRVVNAVATISQTTGIAFLVEGLTDEAYSIDRKAYQPERYGDRWAPILVVWEPDAREGVAGHGGSRAVTMSDTGLSHFVTGFVAIDSSDRENTNLDSLEAVLLHEFGHVVGLDHSDDPQELMAPVYRGQPGLGPGDLAGLAAVGTAPCAADL